MMTIVVSNASSAPISAPPQRSIIFWNDAPVLGYATITQVSRLVWMPSHCVP
jgi:hypothetical protein